MVALYSFHLHFLTLTLVSLSSLLTNILGGFLVPDILFKRLSLLLRPLQCYRLFFLPVPDHLLSSEPVKLLLPQCNTVPYLPKDLSRDILLRLPAKSLLRFKSVCKEWNAIITSSSFIKEHFNDDTNTTTLAIYALDYDRDAESLYRVSYYDETLEKQDEIPDHLVLWGEIVYFRGPCAGIYCLYIGKNKFALWNPTTRRFRFIQCCCSHLFDDVGFGIDPLTDDFKIVLIRGASNISPCFAVYTSTSDSWKYLEQESLADSEASIYNPFKPDGDTYLNGFYYWIKLKHIEDPRHFSLVAFDMHNETFEETTMPEVARDDVSLHLLNDSLALVSFDSFEDQLVEIWLMEKKGHWTKFLSVFPPFNCLYTVGFWGRNKMLLIGAYNGTKQLMEYDLYSHTARQVTTENEVPHTEVMPIYFKESFLSLKDKDGIQDYDTRSAESLDYLGYKGPLCDIVHHMFRLAARDGMVTWPLDGDGFYDMDEQVLG